MRLCATLPGAGNTDLNMADPDLALLGVSTLFILTLDGFFTLEPQFPSLKQEV